MGLFGPAEPITQRRRRGHYELGIEVPPAKRVAAAFTELATAM
jgi:hypothetical protein